MDLNSYRGRQPMKTTYTGVASHVPLAGEPRGYYHDVQTPEHTVATSLNYTSAERSAPYWSTSAVPSDSRRVPERAPPPRPAAAAPDPPPADVDAAHDAELTNIVLYLKNYYGQDEDESHQGLDTITADDALAIAQCFYLDLYRLLRERRAARRNTREHDGPHGNSFAGEPTPQHVGVPIHDPPEAEAPPPPVTHSSPVMRKPPPISLKDPSAPRMTPRNSPLRRSSLKDSADRPIAPRSRSATPHSWNTPRRENNSRGKDVQRPPLHPKSPDVRYAHSRGSTPRHNTSPSRERRNRNMRCSSASDRDDAASESGSARRVKSDSKRGMSSAASTPRQDTSMMRSAHSRGIPLVPMPLRIAMPRMRRGGHLIKYALHGGKPMGRFFSIEDRGSDSGAFESKILTPHLCWAPTAADTPSGKLNLLHLVDVRTGPSSSFKRHKKTGDVLGVREYGRETIPDYMCFTLVFNSRTLCLAALNESDLQLWVGGMLSILAENEKLR